MNKILAASSLVLAASCASNQHDLSPSFGKAFAGNAAAQIVDPTPAVGAPEGDGATIDLAVERYKTDKVKRGDSGEFKPGQESKEGGN